MKVSVTQTGGPLGVPYRYELDDASLSDHDTDALRRHTQAVMRTEAPERRYPGELGYSVRIDPDDGEPIEASYTDSSMPDDVRKLVSWVEDHPHGSHDVGR
jgi:hypothetical protein